MSELLRVGAITAEDIGGYVRRHATVIEQFDHLTQDSGNVSWLVKVEDQRLFVKTAGGQDGANHGGSVPYFDHAGRVNLLRNAVELAQSCSHSALPRLLNVIESPSGPALVYEAATGDLVRVPPESRDDPDSAYQRFAHLPAEQLLGVFDVLIDLHVALEAAGWIASAVCTEIRVDLPDDARLAYAVAPAAERYRMAATAPEKQIRQPPPRGGLLPSSSWHPPRIPPL